MVDVFCFSLSGKDNYRCPPSPREEQVLHIGAHRSHALFWGQNALNCGENGIFLLTFCHLEAIEPCGSGLENMVSLNLILGFGSFQHHSIQWNSVKFSTQKVEHLVDPESHLTNIYRLTCRCL